MTFRPDRRLLALALLLAGLPALAGPAQDPLAKARSAIEAGDGIAAEVAARQALAQGAARASVAAYMGEAYALQDKNGDALSWLEPGEFDAASAERGFRALGRIKADRGAFAEAAAAYDNALVANPRSAGTWVDIARLRYRSGEQHMVREAVSHALQLDPAQAEGLALQAQLVRDSDGLVASLASFQQALKMAPENVILLGDYAATLGEIGRYKDMLAIVRKMTKLDPGYAQSYYLQAVLAARAGQNDLARRLLWRANKDIGDTPAGLMLEGVLDFRSGRASLAVEKFDNVVRLQPDNERAVVLLARALMASGDAAEATDWLIPLARRATASPYVLTLLGRAYEQLGNRAEAATWLDRAARPPTEGVEAMAPDEGDELALYRSQDDPDRPVAAVARLRDLVTRREFAQASAFAAEVSGRYKGSVDIATLIGDSALLAGEPGPAISAYQQAAQVRRNTALVERMVWALRSAKRPDVARQLLENASSQSPRDLALAAMAGRQALADGDLPLARSMLQRALDLGRVRDARLLGELAQVKLRTGDATGALADARRAYGLQRWNPQVAEVYGQALQANGKAGGGALLTKARQGQPTAINTAVVH